MKKNLLSLFCATLVAFCAFAQPCPSTLSLSLAKGDDPSRVEIELKLTNTSSYLIGYRILLYRTAGGENIQWNQIGNYWLYFNFEDYLDVILANAEIPDDQDINDMEVFMDYLDVKGSIWENQLVIQEKLWVPKGFFYPILEEPTAVGRFCIDMSACEDGEYGFRADDVNCTMHYKFPQGYHIWYLDKPLEFTLYKQGNTVTELRSIPAYFAPSTDITTISGDRQEASVRYYNLAGVESAEPQPGVNIRVTTYTDGSRKSDKILR